MCDFCGDLNFEAELEGCSCMSPGCGLDLDIEPELRFGMQIITVEDNPEWFSGLDTDTDAGIVTEDMLRAALIEAGYSTDDTALD